MHIGETEQKPIHLHQYFVFHRNVYDLFIRLFLAAFNPSATSKDAHHILLYGCTTPGSQQPIWSVRVERAIIDVEKC